MSRFALVLRRKLAAGGFVGIILVVAGGVVLVWSFARFVTEGLGTPAPIAPTERLVIGGLYRHVRNPMYLAVIATIAGQALILQRPVLGWYLAVITVAVVTFVHFYACDGWVDVSDVRRRANAWLAKAAQQSSKHTVGVGASPTPAPAVSHHYDGEVFRGADQ